jgi:hypothetical protein
MNTLILILVSKTLKNPFLQLTIREKLSFGEIEVISDLARVLSPNGRILYKIKR